MRTSLDVAMAKPGPLPAHIGTLADRLRRELDQIDRLLESFLTLAHSQQGPLADESTVSLAELARVAIERRADAISAMGLDVEQQQRPDAWVSRQRDAARPHGRERDRQRRRPQPAGRLGPRHHRGRGRARAARRRERRPGSSTPTRSHSSPQPFRRIGAERTGSDNGAGLGLAIVSSIVEVHGGTLDLEALADGGLRVTITLPLAVRTATGAPA